MLIAPASRNRRIYINNKVQKKSSSYAAGIFLSSVPLGVGRDEWHATTRAHVTITVHNQLHPSLSISRGETSLSPPIPHASHSCLRRRSLFGPYIRLQSAGLGMEWFRETQ